MRRVGSISTYIRNTDPASIAALPGISLPVGLTADGLPVGIELDGPEQSDDRLLSIARLLESSFGEIPRPTVGGQSGDGGTRVALPSRSSPAT